MHRVEIWCSISIIFINLNLLLLQYSGSRVEHKDGFLRVGNQHLIQNGDFTLDFRLFIKTVGLVI